MKRTKSFLGLPEEETRDALKVLAMFRNATRKRARERQEQQVVHQCKDPWCMTAYGRLSRMCDLCYLEATIVAADNRMRNAKYHSRYQFNPESPSAGLVVCQCCGCRFRTIESCPRCGGQATEIQQKVVTRAAQRAHRILRNAIDESSRTLADALAGVETVRRGSPLPRAVPIHFRYDGVCEEDKWQT